MKGDALRAGAAGAVSGLLAGLVPAGSILFALVPPFVFWFALEFALRHTLRPSLPGGFRLAVLTGGWIAAVLIAVEISGAPFPRNETDLYIAGIAAGLAGGVAVAFCLLSVQPRSWGRAVILALAGGALGCPALILGIGLHASIMLAIWQAGMLAVLIRVRRSRSVEALGS